MMPFATPVSDHRTFGTNTRQIILIFHKHQGNSRMFALNHQRVFRCVNNDDGWVFYLTAYIRCYNVNASPQSTAKGPTVSIFTS